MVVDMVPGSPADLQRTRESKGDPRPQLGDKIITVDGIADLARASALGGHRACESHVLVRGADQGRGSARQGPSASSPMSPRGLLKAMTPARLQARIRSGRRRAEARRRPAALSSALREVRLYKATRG